MKRDLQKLQEVFNDETKDIGQRKVAFNDYMDSMLNPKDSKDFNPDTFDPLEDLPEAILSERIRKVPEKIVPTFGLKPKEFRVGQMIGMYESKQDIYLFFAHRCNQLQEQVDTLVKRIEDLENNKK